MILSYKGISPAIASDTFIAPNATIIGDVKIEKGASIWYGTVVRGDMAAIRIGVNSNIQDNCTIHTDLNKPAIIGDKVTVGHNAVVHGCTIENNCLVGMNAVVLSGALLKTGSIIAAGALIKEGQIAGPFQLLAGMPAVVKKELSEKIIQILEQPVDEYLELAKAHIALMEKNGS
jgi:carbonic anhydrase/acetyltransferase-like protein (isoleucine patch superfamily)